MTKSRLDNLTKRITIILGEKELEKTDVSMQIRTYEVHHKISTEQFVKLLKIKYYDSLSIFFTDSSVEVFVINYLKNNETPYKYHFDILKSDHETHIVKNCKCTDLEKIVNEFSLCKYTVDHIEYTMLNN